MSTKEPISDEQLLKHLTTLSESNAFMKFVAPDLLMAFPGLLKSLYLLALNDPKFRTRVEDIYHGHVGSGRIKP